MAITASTTSTSTTTAPAKPASSIVGVYRQHSDAEEAVHQLERAGIPIQRISIIGRDFQVRVDVEGPFRPVCRKALQATP